jgi:hypothetical protein
MLICCLEQYLTRMWDVNRKEAILNTSMEAAFSFIITTVAEHSKMAPVCVVWNLNPGAGCALYHFYESCYDRCCVGANVFP